MSTTMREMLEAGVHFGHQTRFWNPKMAPFIFGHRNKIHIINLEKSLPMFQDAMKYAKQLTANRGTILMVGTKRQAREIVAEEARRAGIPFVDTRWLGGMLTNFATVSKRIERMKDLEQIDFDDVAGSQYTKKELLLMRREQDKLVRTLGGIRNLTKTPSMVWIVDTKKEHLAIDEAQKLGIPVVAILDTNCDPDEVTFPIPGNDDSIRSVNLLTRVVADAVAEGLLARGGAKSGAGAAAAEEPMAEWERELLEQHNAAAEAEKSSQSAAESAKVAGAAAAEAAGDPAPAAAAEESAETAEAASTETASDEAASAEAAPAE